MLKIKNKIPSALTIGGKIVERVLMNNEVVWGRVQTPLYIQNTYNGSNTVTIQQTLTGSPDSSTYAKHLQYSKNGLNWTTITLSSTAYTITLNKGEKVYFRGNEGVFNYWYSKGAKKAITTISANQTHTVGGNINTILDYQDPYGLTLPQGAFNSIFENNTKLTSASDITFTPSVDGSLSSYCYLYLFKKCTNLTTVPKIIPAKKQGQDSCNAMFSYTAITTAPALPATILGNSCYVDTFHGCSKLVNAPALPAKTLKPSCYRALFARCTSLVNAPELPATTLADGCYRELFYGCTSLVNAPKLLSTTLADSCYRELFYGCSKLVNAPALPATVLAQYCYRGIFQNCTSLVNPPKLPATTLATNCYQNAFLGCINLVNPPELPAKVLVEGCYQSTFEGCSKLNNITVYANDISATNCTFRWLYNVASKGTFHNLGTATYPTGASGIPSGWTVVNSNEPDYFYVENTYNGNNNIYVKTRAGYSGTEPTGEFATTLEYSKDKTNWTTINLNYDYHKNGSTVVSNLVTNLTLSLSVGEKVYFRNTSGYFGYVGDNGKHSHQFSSDENIKVGGNIKSLLDYRDMVGTTMKKGCFYEMFFESYNLRDASELILPDTVADSCYLNLFSGCVYLTSIPSLPALTMAPYCYCEMLKNTAITTPPELPSTNLAEYCYKNMLEGTSITTAPALPATTLSVGCYQGLFNSCNKLTTAPVLLATTLVDYCYRYLFMGCTKLNSITTYANNIGAEECTRWWLESVASSGTLHNLGSAIYVTDSGDGVPTGWQIVTE